MSKTGNLDSFDSSYLKSLLAFGVDRLTKEIDILKVEEDKIKPKFTKAFLDNCEGVLNATKNLDVISTKLGEATSSLEKFEKDIPKLFDTCNGFLESCSTVMEDVMDVKLLAAHQSEITDLLDIPQLLDTSVRNGMYDEAMELMSYISRLEVLHPNLSISHGLAEAIQIGSNRLLEQLLSTFRSGAQLPECLRAVGYIRRLSNFSDLELRTIFLSNRDEWISSLIHAIDESNSFNYIKKLADVYRLQVYDTTMQYRTIFYDVGKDPSTASASAAVFSSWARVRIQFLQQQVAQHLPLISEGGQLSAAAEHLGFCSTSLSRIGLDFAPLIEPLVSSAVLTLLAQNLAAADEAFATRLAAHKWVALPAMPSTAGTAAVEGGEEEE